MYTDECQSCCQQLRSSVVEVSNEIEAAFFLIGLGEGYEDFVAAAIKPNPDGQDAILVLATSFISSSPNIDGGRRWVLRQLLP